MCAGGAAHCSAGTCLVSCGTLRLALAQKHAGLFGGSLLQFVEKVAIWFLSLPSDMGPSCEPCCGRALGVRSA